MVSAVFLVAFNLYLFSFDYSYSKLKRASNMNADIANVVIALLGLLCVYTRTRIGLSGYFVLSLISLAHCNSFFLKSHNYTGDQKYTDYFDITCLYYVALDCIQLFSLYFTYQLIVALSKKVEQLQYKTI